MGAESSARVNCAELREILVCFMPEGDARACVSVLRKLRFNSGAHAAATVDDAELLILHTLHCLVKSTDSAAWDAWLTPRVAQCGSLQELFNADERSQHSLLRAARITTEALLPVDQAIYSAEKCSNCGRKTVFYVAPQLSSGDEEQAFFEVCAAGCTS